MGVRGKVMQQACYEHLQTASLDDTQSNTSMQRRPRSEFLIVALVSHAAPLMRDVRRSRTVEYKNAWNSGITSYEGLSR